MSQPISPDLRSTSFLPRQGTAPSIADPERAVVQQVARGALARQESPRQESLPLERLQKLIEEVEQRVQDPAVNPLALYEGLICTIGPERYPEIRLQLMVKMGHCVLQSANYRLAAKIYNAAYQFAQEKVPLEAEATSQLLMKPIKAYLQKMGRRAEVDEFCWKRHRANLVELRKQFTSEFLLSADIRKEQRKISQEFAKLVEDIINSCKALLGPAPCKYCFISLGSLAREEVCPYSDIECGILLENGFEEDHYFLHLAHLLELNLINMGETNWKIATSEAGGIEVKGGFSLDVGGMTPAEFRMNPHSMARMQKIGGGDQISNNALREVSYMFGADSLFASYQEELKEILDEPLAPGLLRRQNIAIKLLTDHLDNPEFHHESLNLLGDQLVNQRFSVSWEELSQPDEKTSCIDVKKHLCRFIPMCLSGMALFKGITATNSLDRIHELQKLGLFSPFWSDKLIQWLSTAFRLRIEAHLHYRSENEQMALWADPRFPQRKMFSMQDRERLSLWSQTTLLPFRDAVQRWLQDTICPAFVDPQPLLAPLVALGQKWLSEGSLAKAQAALEEALRYVEEKRRHEVLLPLAHVQRHLGNGELAEQLYAQAVEVQPDLRAAVKHFQQQIALKREAHRELIQEVSSAPSLQAFLSKKLMRLEKVLTHLNRLSIHVQGLELRLLDLEQTTESQRAKKGVAVDKISLMEQLRQESNDTALLQLRTIAINQLSELLRVIPGVVLQEALLQVQQEVLCMSFDAQNSYTWSLPALLSKVCSLAIRKEFQGTCAGDVLFTPLAGWIEELRGVGRDLAPEAMHPVLTYIYQQLPDTFKPLFFDCIQSHGQHFDLPLANGLRASALAKGYQWNRLLDSADMGYPDTIGNAVDSLVRLLPAVRRIVAKTPRVALVDSLKGLLPLLLTPQELFRLQNSSAKKTKELLTPFLVQVQALIDQLEALHRQYDGMSPKPLQGLEERLLVFLKKISEGYQRFLALLKGANEEKANFLLSPRVILKGTNMGRVILHEEWGRALIQLVHAKKDPTQFGRHKVLQRGSFYFKVNPELPGIEYAVWSFNQLVTGQGSPPHELLRLQWGAERHVVLLSRTVPGRTLLEVLTETPEKLKLLDQEQYSQMLLLALLTNPEDGNGLNYIVHEQANQRLQIIGVDNDHAFVHPLKPQGLFSKGPKALVKTMLYCLDQMVQPIDPAARRHFLSLHPAELLKRWLNELEAQNQRYEKQFSADEINAFFQLDPEFAVVIPIYLKRGLVSEIYSKMLQLQEALRSHPKMTHLDLLLLLHPSLGRIYNEALHKFTKPLERFAAITEGEYQTSSVSNVLISKTKSKQMLMPMTGVNPKHLDEMKNLGHTPRQALKELREIVLQTTGFENIKQDLIEGPGKIFELVAVPDLVEKMLESIDFQPLSDDQQLQILRRIQGKRLSKLILRGFRLVDNPLFNSVLQASPELTTLDLQNCSTAPNLSWIESLCPHLTFLRCTGCPRLIIFGQERLFFLEPRKCVFPHLRKLILDRCENLGLLYLSAPELRVLSLKRCSTLAILQLDPWASMHKLSLAGVPVSIVDQLVANCAQLAELNVSQLIVEFSYFAKWVTKFPEIAITSTCALFGSKTEPSQLAPVLGRLRGLSTAWAVPETLRASLPQHCPELKHIFDTPLFFGKNQWEEFFGKVGVEPPLPPDILEILNSPCPFWPGKKVHETHLLTLIPRTVNGEPLTLDRLGELIQRPKQGTATKYGYYSDELKKQYGAKTLGAAHWVLMTRDVIPGSRRKSFEEQQQLIANVGKDYAVPMLLDAAVSILMAYFAKGERLYGNKPWTYTRCQEKASYQSVVGGFAADGLSVSNSRYDGVHGDVCVAALRKFF